MFVLVSGLVCVRLHLMCRRAHKIVAMAVTVAAKVGFGGERKFIYVD